MNIREPFVSGDPEIDQWLFEQMKEAQLENGDPCMNNERYADADNQEQCDAYDEAKNSGCCGREDKLITYSSGRKFWIGFNYGH